MNTPSPTHKLPSAYLRERVDIQLVGCGGTGSHMLHALARIHVSLLALGHPAGFRVTAWDDDVVTQANAGRQLFSPSDIGRSKASVLMDRVNRFYGLDWQARTERVESLRYSNTQIVIGCVDNNEARKTLHNNCFNHSTYWLDCGNEATNGQVIIGNGSSDKHRLPLASQLFPQILCKSTSPNVPSCSLAGALLRQDLFVNQMAATLGANLIWKLFRHGSLNIHGFFFDLDTGTTSALPVDEKHWARLGFKYDT